MWGSHDLKLESNSILLKEIELVYFLNNEKYKDKQSNFTPICSTFCSVFAQNILSLSNLTIYGLGHRPSSRFNLLTKQVSRYAF